MDYALCNPDSNELYYMQPWQQQTTVILQILFAFPKATNYAICNPYITGLYYDQPSQKWTTLFASPAANTKPEAGTGMNG